MYITSATKKEPTHCKACSPAMVRHVPHLQAASKSLTLPREWARCGFTRVLHAWCALSFDRCSQYARSDVGPPRMSPLVPRVVALDADRNMEPTERLMPMCLRTYNKRSR
jgi:hypothetical protein